jgi:hypothetical protein
MATIGIKQYKPMQSLGIKNYKPMQTLGMKSYISNHPPSNNPLSHSRDGIIYNASNSADTQREPMKHNSFKQNDYTKNIKPATIEKARKKKPDENSDKKFA